MILLFSLHFHANTHLYPINFITLIIGTISPKTYRLSFFHIWWLRIFILSYDTYGHLKNKNIVNNNNILISCIHKFLRFHNSHAHVPPCMLCIQCVSSRVVIQYMSLHDFMFDIHFFMGSLPYLCLFYNDKFSLCSTSPKSYILLNHQVYHVSRIY